MGDDAAASSIIAKVGLWWPAADEGNLRAAADAWDRLARAVDDAALGTRGSAGQATASWKGDAAGRFTRLASQQQTALTTNATASRQLASGLRQYADAVAEAKRKVEELAVTIGASIVVGTALAFFTFGVSEAAAAGVTAGLLTAAEAIGFALSDTVAAIIAGTVTGIAVGAVEGVAVDAAVAQPLRVEVFHDGGYSLPELESSALFGGAAGGVAGGAFGGVAARPVARTAAGDFSSLRAPGGRLRAAIDPENWGAQGGRFSVGVHEGATAFTRQERTTADLLAGEGRSVQARPESTISKIKSPDAIIRTGPNDPGTYTEFKTPTAVTSSAVKNEIVRAGKQLDPYGNGDVVVDGRSIGLTRDAAEAGLRRAAGQAMAHGQTLPSRIRIVLADGTSITSP